MNGYESEKIRQKIENGNFISNNGRILQMLDVLTGDYKKLKELRYVLSDPESQLPLRTHHPSNILPPS